MYEFVFFKVFNNKHVWLFVESSTMTPDDWHLRDGPMLELTVPHAAAQFGRAIEIWHKIPWHCTPKRLKV